MEIQEQADYVPELTEIEKQTQYLPELTLEKCQYWGTRANDCRITVLMIQLTEKAWKEGYDKVYTREGCKEMANSVQFDDTPDFAKKFTNECISKLKMRGELYGPPLEPGTGK